MAAGESPLLTAISSSARQLHSLIRCIAFTSKVLVQLSDTGVKLSSYDSSVLEGHVLLERKLFTSYRYDSDEPPTPFETSLPALLEILQIFSNSTENNREATRFAPHYNPAKQSAFNTASLGLPSQLCTISYAGEGSPLTITMTDIHNDPSNFNGPGTVETTCDLTTYEPATSSQDDRDIPFRRSNLAGKIILQSSWLADALAELSTTNPERIILTISPRQGFTLSATGSLGSAEVSFDASTANAPGSMTSFSNPNSVTQDPYASTPSAAVTDKNSSGGVLETFLAQHKSTNSYKFAHLRATLLAMKSSSKTSVRVDTQGVLSLQFMIELDPESNKSADSANGPGEMSFVDFRFVPLVDDDESMDRNRIMENTTSERGSKLAGRTNGRGTAEADESTESEGN